MPLTSAVPKALFPFVDRVKSIKVVLHLLLEELHEADVDDVCIVVSSGQKEIIIQYIEAVLNFCGASLPLRICIIEQQEPKGFGDAVLQAKGFIDKEPFVLMLGDHVHFSSSGQPSCISQIVEAFDKMRPKAMIGVHDVDEDVLHMMGVATGTAVEGQVYRCTEFVEKPDRKTARRWLRTEGLEEGRYLAHCGIYIFDPEIFNCLEEEKSIVGKDGRELELAAAQVRLLQRYSDSYYLFRIDGKAYDMGNPDGYLRAFMAIAGVVTREYGDCKEHD